MGQICDRWCRFKCPTNFDFFRGDYGACLLSVMLQCGSPLFRQWWLWSRPGWWPVAVTDTEVVAGRALSAGMVAVGGHWHWGGGGQSLVGRDGGRWRSPTLRWWPAEPCGVNATRLSRRWSWWSLSRRGDATTTTPTQPHRSKLVQASVV